MNQSIASPLRDFVATPDGLQASVDLNEGLWQATLFARGSREQWERLYFPLFRYGNRGQRTGPWDFDLDPERKGRPLLPAFWIYLDGRKLGLWYFQRPSLKDIEERIFRGRFAFFIPEDGSHELKLAAYRPESTEGLEWLGGWIEPDPEDHLLAAEEVPCVPVSEPPHEAWTRTGFWEERRMLLDGGLARFRAPLQAAFEAVREEGGEEFPRHADGKAITKDVAGPNDLRVIYAAWKMTGEDFWPRLLRDRLQKYLDAENWSSKAEDVYGHGGDSGIAQPFRVLAGMLPALREVLGANDHARLKDALRFVGARFFDRALLMRDYWGGSVLQDHGWRSITSFTAGVLALRNEFEEAVVWIRWALPRTERARAAIPRDGVPASTYLNVRLFASEVIHLREQLKAWTGRDLLVDETPWRKILDCLEVARNHPDLMPWQIDGGNAFLGALAEVFDDPRAQLWEETLLSRPDLVRGSRRLAAGILENFLLRSGKPVSTAVAVSGQVLHWFRDSGWLCCRHPETGWFFTLHGGPCGGLHAWSRAPGPCDRMAGPPVDGHFQLARSQHPLFATPSSPYKLHSGTGSILSINGCGQISDVGYPMSIPSWNGPWSEILSANWDPKTQRCRVIMDLSRMYPPQCGVLHYTREFILGTEPEVFCLIDRIILSRPAELTWRFQIDPTVEVRLQDKHACLEQQDATLVLSSENAAAVGSWSLHPTETVLGYTSSDITYRHLACSSLSPSVGGVFPWKLRSQSHNP